MKIASGILFLIVAVGSALARSYGWYNDYWFTDIILHTTSGVALGAMWLALSKETKQPRYIQLVGIISFAVFGSVLWEFWEWGGWFFFPKYTEFYVPSYTDSLGDIACGMSGGILLSLVFAFFNKRR